MLKSMESRHDWLRLCSVLGRAWFHLRHLSESRGLGTGGTVLRGGGGQQLLCRRRFLCPPLWLLPSVRLRYVPSWRVTSGAGRCGTAQICTNQGKTRAHENTQHSLLPNTRLSCRSENGDGAKPVQFSLTILWFQVEVVAVKVIETQEEK